jgi:RNA polymerase sigma-B factor
MTILGVGQRPIGIPMDARRGSRRRQERRPRRDRRADQLCLARYRRAGDPAALDELVERFMPLARSLAARYSHTSESFEDLVQVASIGLLHAIKRYDPAFGKEFSSFAVPTILGELRCHLRDHTWSVHVPRNLQEVGCRLAAVVDELSSTLARSPTVREVADRLQVSEEQVIEARGALAAHRPASLDAPVSDDDPACLLGDTVGSEDPALAHAKDTALLERCLATLSPLPREVLRLRYHEDLTQSEIGAIVGRSQAHVSWLIRRSLEQMRSTLAGEAERPVIRGCKERGAT